MTVFCSRTRLVVLGVLGVATVLGFGVSWAASVIGGTANDYVHAVQYVSTPRAQPKGTSKTEQVVCPTGLAAIGGGG